MSDEAAVIQHLLEVEKEAGVLVAEAQKKADEKIALARAQSEERFNVSLSNFNAELTSSENQKKDSLRHSHDEVLSQYQKTLDSSPLDVKAFRSLLDSMLAG